MSGDAAGSSVVGVITDLWGTLEAPRYTIHLAARTTDAPLARGDLVYLFLGSAEGFGELDDGSALARAEAEAVAGVGN